MRFDVLQLGRCAVFVASLLIVAPMVLAVEPDGDEPPEISVIDIEDSSVETANFEESVDESEGGEAPAGEEPAEDDIPEAMEAEPAPSEAPEEADEGQDPKSDEVVDLDTGPPQDQSAEADDDEEMPSIDAAILKDVLPGRTTRDELQAQCGKAHKVDKIVGGVRATYRVASLGLMRVTIIDNVIESMAIRLKKPMLAETVASRLQVEGVESVNVSDDDGQLLGQVFPERGILFGFTPKSDPPQVFEVVVEPMDAQPFLARAEARLQTRYADCLLDLKQALELAPTADRAHWLHAELALAAGEPATALKSAQRAIELDPKEPEYRLTLAKVYASTAGYSQAITQLRGVVEAKRVPTLLVARAYCQWGDCVGAAQDRDYQQALQLHMQAIKLVQPLTTSPQANTRRAAKEILLDVNLGVAHDIGWGRWNQKSKVVPKWLEKAATLADDIVSNEQGSPELQLRVYQRGVTALAGISDPPDPTKWIQGLTSLGAKALDEAQDPVYKSHVAWHLGVALSDGVEIENALHQSDKALELGSLAMTCFEQGEAAAKRFPTYDFLRGRLYYRLGAIFAIERADHKQAAGWFEKAVPLLESPVPPCSIFDPARQGETLVSMAVSFWELNNRREALRLTREGVKLMEQAAEEGLMSRAALAIPYGNLASMHEQLGEAQEAQRFADMAARLEAPTKK